MTESQKNIVKIIVEEMGLEPDSLGDVTLKHCINNIMDKLGHVSEDDLFLELSRNKNSLKQLIEEVKVPETWFFRDIEAYNYLEKYVSKLLLNKNCSQIKILSAPCSTGEEAYSIAITLINMGLNISNYSIKAVDISEINLSKAKKALYTKSSFRNMEDSKIDKYFTKLDYRYELKNYFKNSNIEFLNINLIKDFHKFASEEFDVIFFKNLLIYLNEDSRQYILQNIKRVLKNDGILFVGVSELNYFIRNGFESVDHSFSFACRKKIEQANVININKDRIVRQNILEIKSKRENGKVKQDKPKKEQLIVDEFDHKKIKNLMDLGKYNEAEIELERNIKFNNGNFEVYFNYGLIKYVNKSYQLAKDYFLKSIYLEPNNYDALIYMSLIERELGFGDRAETYRIRAEKVFNRMKNE